MYPFTFTKAADSRAALDAGRARRGVTSPAAPRWST